MKRKIFISVIAAALFLVAGFAVWYVSPAGSVDGFVSRYVAGVRLHLKSAVPDDSLSTASLCSYAAAFWMHDLQTMRDDAGAALSRASSSDTLAPLLRKALKDSGAVFLPSRMRYLLDRDLIDETWRICRHDRWATKDEREMMDVAVDGMRSRSSEAFFFRENRTLERIRLRYDGRHLGRRAAMDAYRKSMAGLRRDLRSSDSLHRAALRRIPYAIPPRNAWSHGLNNVKAVYFPVSLPDGRTLWVSHFFRTRGTFPGKFERPDIYGMHPSRSEALSSLRQTAEEEFRLYYESLKKKHGRK